MVSCSARAAIGYPWIFNEIKYFLKTGTDLDPPTVEERVEVCRIHLRKSVEWKGEILGILEMRRHYTNYLKGLPHIKDYRLKLVTTKSLLEIESILDEIRTVTPAKCLQEKWFLFRRITW